MTKTGIFLKFLIDYMLKQLQEGKLEDYSKLKGNHSRRRENYRGHVTIGKRERDDGFERELGRK